MDALGRKGSKAPRQSTMSRTHWSAHSRIQGPTILIMISIAHLCRVRRMSDALLATPKRFQSSLSVQRMHRSIEGEARIDLRNAKILDPLWAGRTFLDEKVRSPGAQTITMRNILSIEPLSAHVSKSKRSVEIQNTDRQQLFLCFLERHSHRKASLRVRPPTLHNVGHGVH